MATTYENIISSDEAVTLSQTSLRSAGPAIPDPVLAAEIVMTKFGARAITMLTAVRHSEDGSTYSSRLSANDCYVCLDEACRKVARVAVKKYAASFAMDCVPFDQALVKIFPDPAAYLARAIKSVIADAARVSRRDIEPISMDAPIGKIGAESGICLSDTIRESSSVKLPDAALEEKSDSEAFRNALRVGMAKISPNYREALKRDLARERERQAGCKVSPESDKDRQTVCRARGALAEIIRKECGDDNPFVRLMVQQRSGRVRRKVQPTVNWTGERQEALFRKLMDTPWAVRESDHIAASVGEAVVNDVSSASQVAPPSPEMRQAIRVLDLYTVSYPEPANEAALELWNKGREARTAGRLEDALAFFKACYEQDKSFIPALNNVGNIYSQLGNLSDALKVFISIIELNRPGEHNFIAATNAADIYLTWFDAGRNKEKNIEQAIHFAKLAMRKPTPMRACNLLLAYAKDRYFEDARLVMQSVLRENSPECSSEKFLNTLFQIRDADLVSWWNWLDGELEKE